MEKETRVVAGGTFDSFHKGHEHFLKKASSLGRVKIGLTSDRMARETKGEEVETYEERKKNLLDFLPEAEVEKIEDPVGFAVEEDFNYIIVSPETRSRAERINTERREAGKGEIEIVEVDFVFAQNGEPISSTKIRNGEIDREGKVLTQ